MFKSMKIGLLIAVLTSLSAFAQPQDDSLLEQLPDEVLLQIIQNSVLSPNDLGRNEQVCRRWAGLLKDSQAGWLAQVAKVSSPLAANFASYKPLSSVFTQSFAQSWSQWLTPDFVKAVATNMAAMGTEDRTRLVAAEQLGNQAIRSHLSKLMVDNPLRVFGRLLQAYIRAGSAIAREFRC